MACLGRGDWIVPRRLMCFLFWTGTLMLFVGILLVVTSKHKGTVFLSWGAVLLGLGSCILLVCLGLCAHAYYVIAESRTNAEHSLIDHLQLQRKAQYSVPSCSSVVDGIWEPKVDSYLGVNGKEATANSNGHCSTSEFRQLMVPMENGIHVRHQPFPSGRGVAQEDGKGEGGGRRSAESVSMTGESKEDVDPMTRINEDGGYSGPAASIYSIPPPPSYSSQFSPQYAYSSSSSTSRIIDSFPPAPPPPAVFPDQDATSRPDSHQSDERSSPASVTSIPSHLKTISSSATSVSRAARIDPSQQQQQYLHHSPHHFSDFRNNTSSQSSAPNSSTEFEPDVEVSRTLRRSSPSGRRKHTAQHRDTRPLNNTPVNCYQTDVGGGSDHDPLLGRKPPRLNFDPITYDGDVTADHVVKGEDATTAAPWRLASTIPSGSGTDVWTSEAGSLLSRRPPQAGLRRPPGPASITRPFGHGSVTVTPLYRAPKTPPSERHNAVTTGGGVTVRSPEAMRSVAPRRGAMSARVSARGPEGQTGGPYSSSTVPTVSVTPCIADRQIDISVCQSDVTVYDNVIDNVRL